ncbi:ninja-family protein AFP3-like [Solanum pennellii]|uniref:Ninja-family protein n=1 Tax=Solanum pennellii TaxID=28526 RepID=A0ABM1V3Q7_SOLPN|nr:ninja-family protein AFP3-like [Solanum pennellii]
MDKIGENSRNVKLNLGRSLIGSVASSLTELETQQPPNRWKSAKEVGEKLRKLLYKMPSVFYDGPNGKKTKGYLLYSFTKREDLKIVCVCHASFFTPTEFVKHGGGGDVDVENPLNYINIILDY